MAKWEVSLDGKVIVEAQTQNEAFRKAAAVVEHDPSIVGLYDALQCDESTPVGCACGLPHRGGGHG